MLNIFRSPIQIAKNDYARCQKHRAESILEFRRNAAREVLLLHPDSALLMGTTFDHFLAYSTNSDTLISGRFNDRHFPALDSVIDGSIDEYESAVNRYEEKVSAYSPNAHQHQKQLLERPREYFYGMNDETRRELFTKGYLIGDEDKGDLIIAAKVCINGTKIASASCVKPKASGYFAKQIYNKILLKEIQSESGISVISLTLIMFGYGSTGTEYYEMLYDDRSNFLVSTCKRNTG